MTTDRFLDLEFRPVLPQRRDVRIGCIGAGFIMADCHLVAYRQAGFQPVAIASQRPERAKGVAARHHIPQVYASSEELLSDETIEVVDIAVPPDRQLEIVRNAVNKSHIRGILAQKPLAPSLTEAAEIVRLCQDAGIVLAVNQNMRYDQSVRAANHLIQRGDLGEPVLATIEMRAVPHWMDWQERQGWVTLRIMSIHHLDTFRFWFGDPDRVFASVRPDPRTAERFEHKDGICLYILEYEDGLRASGWDDVWTGPADDEVPADIGIRWRIEGTDGLALGTIGWPDYPAKTPSTLDFSSRRRPGYRFQPRWSEVWFPDAFAGPMAELLCALEAGEAPSLNGADNLRTMALVEACYASAESHQAVEPQRLLDAV